jgi:membrane protease YdiL (CAAX protease family)
VTTTWIKPLGRTTGVLLFELLVLQGLRFLLKELGFLFLPRTLPDDRLLSSLAMLLLTAVVIWFCRRQGVTLNYWPNLQTKHKKILYGLAVLISAALLVSSLTINAPLQWTEILFTLHGIVLTPLYEEIVFRGRVWTRLQSTGAHTGVVYAISTLLFALWHVGYADSLWLNTSDHQRFGFTLLMKAMIGLIYGCIVGLVRWKAGNTFAATLMHAVMNIFGR